jgi:predicted nucleic acid-binding protein
MGKKKINHILFDTNVLFRFMEGDESTKSILDKIGKERTSFSIITTAEAFAGCSKIEFAILKSVFANYTIYHLSNESSTIFNGLIQSYHTRHSKWIPDALIASIAIANNLELFTYNRKDFDFIKDLKLFNPK